MKNLGFIPSSQKATEKGKTWYLGNTLNTVIKGDVTSTLVQLGQYISAIANHGIAYKPHLLKEVIQQKEGGQKHCCTKAKPSN